MTNILIYTWTYCPFCVKAKKLLDDKKFPYKEIIIDSNDAKKRELYERTGQSTVPFIFIDGEFIGGYIELKALNDQGKLEEKIK